MYIFKVYNVTVRYMYSLGNDYHNEVNTHLLTLKIYPAHLKYTTQNPYLITVAHTEVWTH